MADNFIVNALKNVNPAEAMPFGAASTPEGSPTVLSSMLGGLFGMPKRLIDAAKDAPAGVPVGDMTPEQKDAYQRLIGASTETAMALAGTGAPAAEAGAAGIFGGRLANTADLAALDRAKVLGKNDYSPVHINRQTGWRLDPADMQWKNEIPDNKAMVNPRLLGMFHNEGAHAEGMMRDMLHHPDLYKAYPKLGEYRTAIDVGPTSGEFLQVNGTPIINVQAPNAQEARSVLLHELQHGVQGIENFAQGANVPFYAKELEKELRNAGKLHNYDFAAMDKSAKDAYHRTAGEVEARNVEKRANFGPNARSVTPPWESHDVPYANQLYLNHNTLKASPVQQWLDLGSDKLSIIRALKDK